MSAALAAREPWLGVVPVLAMGADAVLLDLLARDPEPLATDHRYFPGLRPHDAGLPLRHFNYEEERAAEEAREEARRALLERLREEQRRRALAQHAARRDRERNQASAEVAWRRDIKAGWLEMLRDAASRVRGTPHEAVLLPDLERDMATVAGWPVEAPFPGWLDRDRFKAAFAGRLAACEGTSS
jgi:hypothetical protein